MDWYIYTGILICFIITYFINNHYKTDKANYQLKLDAASYFNNGEYDIALKYYEELLRTKLTKKERTNIFLITSRCYMEQKNMEKAYERIKQAEHLKPKYWLIEQYRTLYYKKDFDFNMAEENYRKELISKPSPGRYISLAEMFLALFEYNKAEDVLKEGISKFTKNRDLHISLLNLYFNTADIEKAENLFNLASRKKITDLFKYEFEINSLRKENATFKTETGYELKYIIQNIISLYKNTLNISLNIKIISIENNKANLLDSFIGGEFYYPQDKEYPKDSEGNALKFAAQFALNNLPDKFIEKYNFPKTGFVQLFLNDSLENVDCKLIYHKLLSSDMKKLNFPSKYFSRSYKIMYDNIIKYFQPQKDSHKYFYDNVYIKFEDALKYRPLCEFINKYKNTDYSTLGGKCYLDKALLKGYNNTFVDLINNKQGAEKTIWLTAAFKPDNINDYMIIIEEYAEAYEE